MPAIVVIIPIFLMFRLAGLAGTYVGIILLYTAFNIPFSVWMIKSFFDELNREGLAIVLTTHDLNGMAAHLPHLVALHRRVVAAGPPDEVIVPDVLERTFGARMEVLQHLGMPVVVDGGVPSASVIGELRDLLALGDLAHRFIGAVGAHLPLVPGELPGDRDPHRARRAGGGADGDRGRPERPHQAADRAGGLALVEEVHRLLELLRPGRIEDHAANLAAACGPERKSVCVR